MPPARKHINPEKIPGFLKEKATGAPPFPRLAYGVRRDGAVVWIGKAHREIDGTEHAGKIRHWGFLIKAKEGEMGHFPYSTSIKAEPVPDHVMDDVETEVKKHGKVTIQRQEPLSP